MPQDAPGAKSPRLVQSQGNFCHPQGFIKSAFCYFLYTNIHFRDTFFTLSDAYSHHLGTFCAICNELGVCNYIFKEPFGEL